MGTIIMAMPKTEDSNRLHNLISNSGHRDEVEICHTAAEVLRISNARDSGVVICTRQIFEMNHIELGGYLPDYFGMIILTKNMSLETTSERMVKLLMPFSPRELMSTVEMVTSIIDRRIRKKRRMPPKRSDSEKKIIDKAKGLLMDRNGMTEPEAFRYIQKCSMDTGRNMVESAQMILMLNG